MRVLVAIKVGSLIYQVIGYNLKRILYHCICPDILNTFIPQTLQGENCLLHQVIKMRATFYCQLAVIIN